MQRFWLFSDFSRVLEIASKKILIDKIIDITDMRPGAGTLNLILQIVKCILSRLPIVATYYLPYERF